MARGWESKSVEAQQAEASEASARPRVLLSPEERNKLKQREGLLLSRKHIVAQMEQAKNPRHQKMLTDALAELDTRLKQLE